MPQRTKPAGSQTLVEGRPFYTDGTVTQLHHLIGIQPAVLEQRLGYEPGRLSQGWFLLVLDESVAVGEFIWGGSTVFSGGTHPTRTEEFGGTRYRIPVQDLTRFDIYRRSDWDETTSNINMNTLLGHQVELLNDRTSPYLIAKVMPVVRHDKDKPSHVQYPDAPRGQGIKQWELRVEKRFLVKAWVKAGSTYHGGGLIR